MPTNTEVFLRSYDYAGNVDLRKGYFHKENCGNHA